MTDDPVDEMLAAMLPAGSPLRAGVARALGLLAADGCLTGMRQTAAGAWSTPGDPPDWTARPGDALMLRRWDVGYAYDTAAGALEIRTPRVLLRHVARGHGPDLLRAHRAAADPPVAVPAGRIVVVSRRAGSACGVLPEPLQPAPAAQWLDDHSAGRRPLPDLKRLLDPGEAVAGASWMCVYDGPGSVVTLSRGQWGQHAVALEPVPELASPHLRALRTAGTDGSLVSLAVDLAEHGGPLAWPAGLDPRLLGSPTLWPDPAGTFAWWHRPHDHAATDGQPAAGLGPVLARPADADRQWPRSRRPPSG